MNENELSRVSGIVSGIVLGVNFRWFTQRHAADLGLVGYVRNRSDGAVEFVAEGSRGDLNHLLDTVRVGPASAVVENVETQWSVPTGEFHRFDIRF